MLEMARGEGQRRGRGGWKRDKGRKGRRETQSKAPGAPFVDIISQPLRPAHTLANIYSLSYVHMLPFLPGGFGSGRLALLICKRGTSGSQLCQNWDLVRLRFDHTSTDQCRTFNSGFNKLTCGGRNTCADSQWEERQSLRGGGMLSHVETHM